MDKLFLKLSGSYGMAVALLLSGVGPKVALALSSQGIDTEAGLPYWELQEPGISLRLVQRLPDQTRAFFLARGFSRDDVETIAQSCVFQTVLTNTAQADPAAALKYSLREWQVRRAQRVTGLKTREDWSEEWAAQAIPMPARIAFEWALFPTQQINHSGDYNWGMTVFNLPLDTRFDLEVVWEQFGKRQSAVLKDMHCASDATPVEVAP